MSFTGSNNTRGPYNSSSSPTTPINCGTHLNSYGLEPGGFSSPWDSLLNNLSPSSSGSGSSCSYNNSRYSRTPDDLSYFSDHNSSLFNDSDGNNSSYFGNNGDVSDDLFLNDSITTMNHQMNNLSLSSQNSSPSLGFNYCDDHVKSILELYCKTCSKIMCYQCYDVKHLHHQVVLLIDEIENAQIEARYIMKEILNEISVQENELNQIKMMESDLEKSAEQALDILESSTNKYLKELVTTITAKKNEQLRTIDQIKVTKANELKSRAQMLSNTKVQLENSLMCTFQTSNNLRSLMYFKATKSAELLKIRKTRRDLPSLEREKIVFKNNIDFAPSIIKFGSAKLERLGTIGDGRTVNQNRYCDLNLLKANDVAMHSPGRPIANNHFPVVINFKNQTAEGIFVIGDSSADPQDNLCRPWGVACDKDGYLIVADRSHNRIQIFRIDGTFVRMFGTFGPGALEFNRPAGVVVDNRGRIIIADKDNHRIQIVTREGDYLLSFGERGNGPGQFQYPWDVAVNNACQIVVSDTKNRRVQLFSPEGIFLNKYGFETTSIGKQMDSPRGVAFAPNGQLVITDFNQHHILVIDPEFTKANLKVIGYHSGNKFNRPQGVIVDDDGNIIVADSLNSAIKVFDSFGNFKWKFEGKGSYEMIRPSGIALTPKGNLAVVDYGHNRVIIF